MTNKISIFLISSAFYVSSCNNPTKKLLPIGITKENTLRGFTGKVYLSASRNVVNYKEPDFMTPAFNKLKKLCREIKAIQISIKENQFHIKAALENGKMLSYAKKINQLPQPDTQFDTKTTITFNKNKAERNCDELYKLIDFIEWDYENNKFEHPKYIIPQALIKKLQDLEIQQDSHLLRKLKL